MTKITGSRDNQKEKTIRSFLKEAAEVMANAGIETPMQEARYLTGRLLKLSPAEVLASSDQVIFPDQLMQLNQAVSRRAKHEPAAYIVGSHGFYGRDFSVGKGVLIPRPDTEILIEKILEANASWPNKIRLMDCFTGCGCIGITLALELISRGYEVELTLTDISYEALAYARENINKYGLGQVCRLLKADIWPEENTKWHIITANPPYISSEEMTALQPEVSRYEPVLALDGGDDGLFFYRRIFAEARQFIHNSGMLACEHGYDQAAEVRQIAEENGWQKIEQYKDYGGNARVTISNGI